MSNLRVHVLIPSPMKSDKHIQEVQIIMQILFHCKALNDLQLFL
jgi:hypothetical protein